ncbi:MAG: hypothetical protein O9340_04900 [Cyclobacteriaceae bacterium]|jgi:hypothetical protein|nr:hypothetical protein [Cyclobacteriaceae bacterium]
MNASGYGLKMLIEINPFIEGKPDKTIENLFFFTIFARLIRP